MFPTYIYGIPSHFTVLRQRYFCRDRDVTVHTRKSSTGGVNIYCYSIFWYCDYCLIPDCARNNVVTGQLLDQCFGSESAELLGLPDPNRLLFVRILQTTDKKYRINLISTVVLFLRTVNYLQKVESEKVGLFVIGNPLKKWVGPDEWFGSADLDPDPYSTDHLRILSFNFIQRLNVSILMYGMKGFCTIFCSSPCEIKIIMQPFAAVLLFNRPVHFIQATSRVQKVDYMYFNKRESERRIDSVVFVTSVSWLFIEWFW
jgi:hypothetical protein